MGCAQCGRCKGANNYPPVMTLLLTFARPAFVIHVADRLVSRAGTAVDREANKTVLFLGRDGAGVMSYTGAANLGTRRTDEVIASAVARDDLSARPISALRSRLGPSYQVGDIGQVVLDIAHSLSAAAPDSLSARIVPRFVATGIQWKFREPDLLYRIHPFIWAGERRDPKSGYKIFSHARTEGSHLHALPEGWLAAHEGQELLGRCLALGDHPDAVASELAQAVRDVASRNPEVIGSDLMSVSIPSPAFDQTVLARFDGDPSPYGGFTPWIVTANMVMSPVKASDGWFAPFGPWTLAIVAPAGALIGMASGQFEARPQRPVDADRPKPTQKA